MNNFDCNKCVHRNVCAYKEHVPKHEDEESNSVFELVLSCKEYREEVSLLRTSDSPTVAFLNHVGTATGTKSQEADLRPHTY